MNTSSFYKYTTPFLVLVLSLISNASYASCSAQGQPCSCVSASETISGTEQCNQIPDSTTCACGCSCQKNP